MDTSPAFSLGHTGSCDSNVPGLQHLHSAFSLAHTGSCDSGGSYVAGLQQLHSGNNFFSGRDPIIPNRLVTPASITLSARSGLASSGYDSESGSPRPIGVVWSNLFQGGYLSDPQRTQMLERQFVEFEYKKQSCKGFALHVAAMHAQGVAFLRSLIQSRADINLECTYASYKGAIAAIQPIHLAAGQGAEENLKVLLAAKADVEAHAKFDEEYFYTPIHDACYLGQLGSTKILLEHQADPNRANKDGLTPLHIAARQGFADLAQVLLQAGANPNSRNEKALTPLLMAVEGDRFPQDHLHVLMRGMTNRIACLLEVAARSPSAAVALTRHWQEMTGRQNAVNMRVSLSSRWSGDSQESQPHRRFSEDRLAAYRSSDMVTLDMWLQLASLAPQAAEQLLDALTSVPHVQDSSRHPLPKHACLKSAMCTSYVQATTWDYDFSRHSGQTHPFWHDRLAPRVEGRDLVEVAVKYVALPGLLSAKVFHVLAKTPRLQIFSRCAIQALLNYAWKSLVRQYYVVLTIRNLMLAVLLFILAVSHPDDDWSRRACWSLVFACTLQSFMQDCSQILGYIRFLRQPMDYFNRFATWISFGGQVLTFVLCMRCMHTLRFDDHPVLLAVCSLLRWLQMLNALRAFKFFGERILPILESFYKMTPMIVVTCISFLGFVNACAAVDAEDSIDDDDGSFRRIFVSAFRLLFTGDGAGMDEVLRLGGRGGWGDWFTQSLLGVAIFGFCVCMLNLFIAVHGEAYDLAQERCLALYFKERSRICLQCFLEQYYTGRTLRRKGRLSLLILGLGLGLWSWLLTMASTAPLLITLSCMLSVVFMICQVIVLARPWAKIKRETAGPGVTAKASHRAIGEEGSLQPVEELEVNEIPPDPMGIIANCGSSEVYSEACFLWICHRIDWQERQFWPDFDDISGAQGRMGSLKLSNQRHADSMKQELNRAEGRIQKRLDTIEKNLQLIDPPAMESRLQRIEELLRHLVETPGERGPPLKATL